MGWPVPSASHRREPPARPTQEGIAMQTLTKNDHAPKVLRAARRHLRLAKRAGNATAAELALRIAAPVEALKVAVASAAAAREAADDAFDDWTQDDASLDRAVLSAHRKADDWDADHPGSATKALLFEGAPASQITKAPREDEPDLVAKLVARGEKLPAEHPARAVLPKLVELAAASRKSGRAWVDATQRAGAASAAADIARLAVVRAYRDNAIDIARACGDDVADACFPTLRAAGRRGEDGDAETDTDLVAPAG